MAKTDCEATLRALDRADIAATERTYYQGNPNQQLTVITTDDVEFVFDAASGDLRELRPSPKWLEKQLDNPNFITYVVRAGLVRGRAHDVLQQIARWFAEQQQRTTTAASPQVVRGVASAWNR